MLDFIKVLTSLSEILEEASNLSVAPENISGPWTLSEMYPAGVVRGMHAELLQTLHLFHRAGDISGAERSERRMVGWGFERGRYELAQSAWRFARGHKARQKSAGPSYWNSVMALVSCPETDVTQPSMALQAGIELFPGICVWWGSNVGGSPCSLHSKMTANLPFHMTSTG